MAVSKATNDFLLLLKRSQLLQIDDLQDAAVTVSQLTDPTSAEIANVLVDDGFLTRYQADRLLKGNPRGLLIDGYKVLEVLGCGGMGWVYIAEDVETHWRVALKILPEDSRQDAGTLARFRLEAQAGMMLEHPAIVHTYKMGDYEDIYGPIHFVAMELVRGVNLFEFMLMKKRIDIGQACDIIMQTAEGLSYAHEQGLVHRDVKPENLLVCSDGTVKVLDFGLAMVDDNDEEFSMAMIFGQDRLGTADYISPEQYVDSYQIDHRADIYSLGCTLYFALTGSVPFPGKSQSQKLKGHLKKKPARVQELRPEVSDRLQSIVSKMMAKRPENRIQTAAEVARYLKPFARRLEQRINFRSVLNARLQHAKKRMGDGVGETVKPDQIAAPTDSKQEVRQSTIETIVREETMLDQPRPRERDKDTPDLV
ncbi:MAG TPA: serine/threonine-protein kinase [Pirellulaceae bacterium]|jgi:serine/threonine-protein kinase|nr:serine/threonine-protein kinase [Pirellulaceae bacterium]